MTLIAAKSDYLYKANEVYYNLKEYENTFASEAKAISYAKCILLRNEELEDFYIDGLYVSVYQTSKGYELLFNGYVTEIEVYDKQIVDFRTKKY